MIDWAHVDTLKEDVGDEDFEEIVTLFLAEVDALVTKLAGGVDPKTLADALHFAKGSAAGLGFCNFVALCDAGEKLCRTGKADEVNLPEILACYGQSKQVFLDQMYRQAVG